MNNLSIEEIINNIERGLYLAAGTDVQIHAEDTLLFALQAAYTMYIEDSFAYSNLHFRTDPIDSATGKIVGSYVDDCRKFCDIHSLYAGQNPQELQRLSPRTNPLAIRASNLVMQDNDPSKLFKLINCDTDSVSIWYRKRLPDSVWTDQRLETVVDIDALLLTYQVMHQYLVDEDSNTNAVQNAARNVAIRKRQLLNREWQHALNKVNQSVSSVLSWT